MTDEESAADEFRSRLDTLADRISDAQTEAALDELEAELDSIKDEINQTEFEVPDAETAEDEEDEDDDEEITPPDEELLDTVDELSDSIEEKRGPYAEDVASEVSDAASTVMRSDWTENGVDTVQASVQQFINAVPDVEKTTSSDPEHIADTLESVAEIIEDEMDLHPDEDADIIQQLLDDVDQLQSALDDAEVWSDLSVREQLAGKGFYDVLDHQKDFPPELSAIKVYEKRDQPEKIMLALDMLDSDFMQEYCLEALGRIGDEAAVDDITPLANRRDETAIKALGSIGSEKPVSSLLNHIDSGGSLAITTLRALGEIGSEQAVEDIAEQMQTDDDPEVRSMAARALGMIGDTRATDPLAETLEDDEDNAVRGSAIWALRQIQTKEALEIASEYESDQAYLVQYEAEKAKSAISS